MGLELTCGTSVPNLSGNYAQLWIYCQYLRQNTAFGRFNAIIVYICAT